MGVSIQAESHTVELAFIYEYEHDSDVLEYYDQPHQIKLIYQSKSGKNMGVLHTPDFLVLRQGEVGYEEIKTESELEILANKMPDRYVRSEDGKWRCPPGEKYAAQYGMYYHVRSNNEVSVPFQRNMIFLEDYLDNKCPNVNTEVTDSVVRIVKREFGVTLAELRDLTKDIATSDDINILIATEKIYINLLTDAIADEEHVRVFISREIGQSYVCESDARYLFSELEFSTFNMKEGATFTWNEIPWKIVNIGQDKIYVSGDNGVIISLPHDHFTALLESNEIKGLSKDAKGSIDEEAQNILDNATTDKLEEANRKWSAIRSIIEDDVYTECGISKYTLRDWVRSFRDAEKKYGFGYVGLIPKSGKRGNRNRKLPSDTIKEQDSVIENFYETLTEPNRRSVWSRLVAVCKEKGLIAPSYETFCRTVANRDQYKQVRSRRGERAAYQCEEFFWDLEWSTPRHGDRSVEIAHIDHTQVDIDLVWSKDPKKNLGRPWLTLLIDAYSRRILAIYLSYDEPSYRSCMMVLRECVRRHKKLPQIIVVDRGAEFESVYFETFLAFFRITKKSRPGSKARFGTVIERIFGTTNTAFIHNLAGNTKIMKLVRQVTRKNAPKERAEWTLFWLYVFLSIWCYEIYDNLEHTTLRQTPREVFEASILKNGLRSHRFIQYDENFRRLTLPTTDRGTAKVQQGRGVQIHYIRYWCSEFKSPSVEGKQVEVRYDPFDISYIYAFVNGRWVKCIAEYHALFRGRSEKEIMIATNEIRRLDRVSNRNHTINAKKIANF
ncbi:MAG: TnsA endonuclease N-terminal domain-containing protein [Roseiflexaceae bacterium]